MSTPTSPSAQPPPEPSTDATAAPPWLRTVASRAGAELTRTLPVPGPEADGARPAAVLVLFGDGPAGPDVLLLERSAALRSHASQPAFPGGRVDSTDANRVDTALREATEEVGLDPAGVEVLATTPPFYLRASHHLVTAVLAWWHSPRAVGPVDLAETSSVARVPLAELADPANRIAVRHSADLLTPAFRVHGMLVWGFTAGILDGLLRLGGWEQPWTPAVIVDYPFQRQPSSAPTTASPGAGGARPTGPASAP
ncbi:CoA pyrophosphatase [Frankia sp. AgB32]|uniref:NUDIX hydrolase n=1 Tax=Frankia sp. AgB32 TaxID=631119 RepID=UPI00200EE595|nr:CoA pyrophosphatase [Frankia sp. AgB32]MCK9895166.1 CoA pyrophosphatase [Frankia sp. AgB32]